MRLTHSCGHTVEITTERIAVRIIDFFLETNETLKECLLDLVPVRSGKITGYCPRCKKSVDIKTELFIECYRCGALVPITRIFNYGSDWSLICETCYVDVWKKNHRSSSEEMIINPLSLKIK